MIGDLLSFFPDTLILLLFFRRLPHRPDTPGRILFSVAALLINIPIYLYYYFLPSFPLILGLRPSAYFVLIRLFSAAFYLVWGKRVSFRRSLYFALLFVNALTILQTFHPLVDLLLAGYPSVLQYAVYFTVQTLCLLWVASFVPMERIEQFSPAQAVFQLLLFAFAVYSKNAMGWYRSGAFDIPREIQFYPVAILLFCLALLSFFDRYIVLQREQQQNALVELSQRCQYENLRSKLEEQQEIRKLYHDMKNHLLALGHIPPDAQQAYLSSLLERMESRTRRVETGSEVVNGLLTEKLAAAQKNDIRLEIALDLTPVSYLQAIDLCSIFGNALDNALEAAAQLPLGEPRFILVKSGRLADRLLIRIENSCLPRPLALQESGLPLTQKADLVHHGLGMRSLRQSVERYGGQLRFQLKKEEKRFVLTLLLPLEPPQA